MLVVARLRLILSNAAFEQRCLKHLEVLVSASKLYELRNIEHREQLVMAASLVL
jgi:hypothetical protein